MAVTPRFLAAYKLKAQRRRIVHEVGLCRTMAELTDPLVAGLPADINNQSLTPYFPLPGVQPTPRTYNFSQFFVGGTNPLLATIRNWNYKLSDDSAGISSVYQLFEYDNSEIPGGEDDGTVVDMYDDAVNGQYVDAAAILTTLRPELQAYYRRDGAGPLFPVAGRCGSGLRTIRCDTAVNPFSSGFLRDRERGGFQGGQEITF